MISGGGLGGVVVTATEGGSAALRVFAAMVTAGPLAVGEYPRMIYTLQQHILSTVYRQAGKHEQNVKVSKAKERHKATWRTVVQDISLLYTPTHLDFIRQCQPFLCQ